VFPHAIHLHGPWIWTHLHSSVSNTIEIPSLLSRPDNRDEPIVLRRSFQWVSPHRESEEIDLVIDRVPAGTAVELNGEMLGVSRSLWHRYRFQVTHRLAPRNELVLIFPEVRPAAGSTETRFGVDGFVRLEVTSALLRSAEMVWKWDEPTSQSAMKGLLYIDQSGGLPAPAQLELTLNRHQLLTLPLRNVHPTEPIQWEVGPLDVDPWRPVSIGLPIRQDLRWTIRAGDDVFWQQNAPIGFRKVTLRGQDDHAVVIVGEHEFPVAGDVGGRQGIDREDLRKMIDTSRGRLELVGEIASDEVYDRADRRGVLLCHHVAGNADYRDAVMRHSHHPCVVVIPNGESNPG
jgi:hypothetical protein